MTDDPLIELETHVKRLQPVLVKGNWSTSNRLGLLWVHACVGMISGVQMALYGSSPLIEGVIGPDIRYPLAGLALFGGFLLASGLLRKPRSIPLEVAGLIMIGIWDLCMTLTLAAARFTQHDWHLILPGEPLPTGYASAYPVTVYFGLCALVSIHLSTLRHLRRLPK